ncbi:hypothetical protein UC77_11960 [Clostridium baratii]|nr:hypothetical protein UC77_11960 [Clostridium baratii]
MDLNNIERNQLDYILTDVLPTELSEQFTYSYFYDFLVSKNKEVDDMIKKMIEMKNKNKVKLFEKNSNCWATMPLKYTIMKQLHNEREISLLQPMAAMQLFLFVCIYHKELLTLLDKNAVFSLRYHRKNNELYYKNKNRSVTKYFSDLSKDIGKEVIEQTGLFFSIGPYKSITAFTSSEEWLVLNSKYKYFIRTDYKACFDSIYTHTFNWIIGKDVNDTKEFKNGSVYTSIDRILMNINARTSNGIVVGPEYSRMVAEMLLQTIDRDVYSILLNQNFVVGENYNVYRYVDDIFIFAESEKLANKIVDLYAEASRKYLLQLNEGKLYKSKVPFVLEDWLNDTNLFTNRASMLLFYSHDEQKVFVENYHKEDGEEESEKIIKSHLLKSRALSTSKRTIMNQFNELICKYEAKDRTIVAYFLGTLLNKVGRNKDNVNIFRDNISESVVFDFLDLAFYVYSFFPNYGNTQKLLSIISYVRDEYDIFEKKDKLQNLFNRYAFVFDKANLSDIINLILFCCQAKIEIPYRQEKNIVLDLHEKDNPILWASYLMYSKYSKRYYKEIRDIIGSTLIERIEAIVQKDSVYTYREFWWIIIFNKASFLTTVEQNAIDSIISVLKTGTGTTAGEIMGNLFVDYLKNSNNQFFEWDINKKDFLRNITFKTRQRSIFKNYQENLSSLYWSSL